MMLRVMSEVVKLGKAIEGSRRARGAEGKVVEEGGEFSGGYGVQEADAPTVEESDKGKTLGTCAGVSPRRLRRIQACRRESAQVAVAVLLVWSVEHPTSPGCPQMQMFTFERAAQQLLWWRQSRRRGGGRLMQGRLSMWGAAVCLLTTAAQIQRCCWSPDPMWMIGPSRRMICE